MDKEKIYYVYFHVDPFSDEIVYIGKGCGGRAWDVTRARGNHRQHTEWMKSLMQKGFIPSDWVVIKEKNLSEKDAFQKEKEFAHKNGLTRFNRQQGENQHQAKLTNEQAVEIFKLGLQGVQHKILADRFKVSRTAISMLMSRKNWKTVTAGVAI